MRSIRNARRLAFTALLLVGCRDRLPDPIPAAHPNDETPKEGGTLRLSSFADIRSLDPATSSDGLAPALFQLLYAGLLDYDHDGKLVPDLAERWEVDEAGLHYRFFLREGARFHDGTLLDATDIQRSIERALHPSTPNPSASLYESILGYKEYAARKADRLVGVVVEGPRVVRFDLETPDAMFPFTLAMHPARPVCRSGGNRAEPDFVACGAGPFKLVAWERGQRAELARHPGYFDASRVHLGGVEWTFSVPIASERLKLARGAIDVLHDMLDPDVVAVQNDPRWAAYGEYEAERQIGVETMNTEVPPFDNVEVRRAVAAAIDREHFRMARPGGMRVLYSPVVPALAAQAEDVPCQSFDLAKAREHMARAGLSFDPATGKGGWPKPIPYYVYRQGLYEYTSQLLAQDLAKIGIQLELRVVSYPTWLALTQRRKSVAMSPSGWNQDYPELSSFLEPLFHSKNIADENSSNSSFYRNDAVDHWLDEAHRAVDPAARKELYSKAIRQICADAPVAFTHSFRFFELRQPYVKNYRPHPVWTYDVRFAWVDKPAGAP